MKCFAFTLIVGFGTLDLVTSLPLGYDLADSPIVFGDADELKDIARFARNTDDDNGDVAVAAGISARFGGPSSTYRGHGLSHIGGGYGGGSGYGGNSGSYGNNRYPGLGYPGGAIGSGHHNHYGDFGGQGGGFGGGTFEGGYPFYGGNKHGNANASGSGFGSGGFSESSATANTQHFNQGGLSGSASSASAHSVSQSGRGSFGGYGGRPGGSVASSNAVANAGR